MLTGFRSAFYPPSAQILLHICSFNREIWYCWPRTASSNGRTIEGEQFGVPRMEGVIRAARDSASAEIITKLYESGYSILERNQTAG